jgi:hypothetical protein
VLRDYVKSMKHYWHEAAYIPDAADHAAAWQVAARFLELRDDDFTGGFVLRRFEKFTSAEARTWWAGGTCRLVTAHPDTPGDLPPDIDLEPFTPLIRSLGLPSSLPTWPFALTGPGGPWNSATGRSATARRPPNPPHSSTPSSPRNHAPPCVPQFRDRITQDGAQGQGPGVAPIPQCHPEAGQPSRCRCPFGQLPIMQS